VPPVGAAADSVTVQVVEAPVEIVEGLQLSEETDGPDPPPPPPPVPPALARVSELPVASTPTVWLRLVVVVVNPVERLSVTEATTPLVMIFLFVPLRRQV
jgi:hypothetical protein